MVVLGLFIAARGLLSSCGVQVFLFLVVARAGSRVHGLCSLRHKGSLAEVCELSSFSTQA